MWLLPGMFIYGIVVAGVQFCQPDMLLICVSPRMADMFVYFMFMGICFHDFSLAGFVVLWVCIIMIYVLKMLEKKQLCILSCLVIYTTLPNHL